MEAGGWILGTGTMAENGETTLKPSLKPSSSAFDVRPEWPVDCSLAVAAHTRSDPENSDGGPVLVQSAFESIQ